MVGEVENDEKHIFERPIPIERIVELIPLPYAWGCLLWSVFLGIVVPFSGAYLERFNLNVALGAVFSPTLSPWQAVASLAFNSISLLFLPIFLIRFMRLKLMQAEPELALIARNGERTLHKIFRGIHSVLGPSLMGGAIILVLIVTNLAIPAVSLGNSSTGFFAELLNFAANIVIAFELGSFLWVYLTSLRGLHQLGREGLRLMPSREDPTLGLRRLGSISLSLAFAYFAVVAVGAFTFLILPYGVSDVILFGIFITVGIVMFFLPLGSIHRKMQEAKRAEQTLIREQFNELAGRTGYPGQEDSQGALARIEKLLAIQILDQKAAAIPTWPFDTSILSRFAAIILSVVTILIARIVMIALHL